MIKSVILAGGLGTRLGTLTSAINKSLLPLDHLPIISHLIRFAQNINQDVLLTTTLGQVDNFARVVVNDPVIREKDVYYNIQVEPIGIADAIKYARRFCNDGPVLVILGDNLLDDDGYNQITNLCRELSANINSFSNKILGVCTAFNAEDFGAHVWAVQSDNANCYGVIELDDLGIPISIQEKPKQPRSDLIITGIYLFDRRVWDILDNIQPSDRGEYEITDVLNEYLKIGELKAHVLQGDWFDIGQSIESYWDIIYRRHDKQ